MTSTRVGRVRSTLGALAAIGLLAAGCGDDSGGSSGLTEVGAGEVRLLAAGDGETGDTAVLPGEHQVGQTATQQISISMSVSGGGQRVDADLDMNVTAEVTEVAADGGVVISETVNSVDVSSPDPTVQSAMQAEMASMVGQAIVTRYDAHGMPVETTMQDGSPVPGDMDLQSSEPIFPAEPVAVGATWAAGIEAEQDGMSMVMNANYELVELSADEYVVDIVMGADIDESVGGATVEGDVSAEGGIRGSRSNPLVVQSTFEMDMDLTAAQGGVSETLRMNFTVEVASS